MPRKRSHKPSWRKIEQRWKQLAGPPTHPLPQKSTFSGPIIAPDEHVQDRLFIGVYPCGIVYADRTREANGDYKKLALLCYKSLALEVAVDCPADLRAEIESNARQIMRRAGEQFQISTCGQTVTLGGP